MTYRFGEFTANDETRLLTKDGEEIHLTPKAFELLNLLVENRSRAVPKAELQQLMWPSSYVEETNLASLVAEIRRALNDSASNPRYVRTVYAFGYQFVSDVEVDIHLSTRDRTNFALTFQRQQILLMEGANVIGRSSDAAIPIDSPNMSRYHARIFVTQGNATLEDLGSKNGTLLNGTRISTQSPLADGDEIRLGAITLIFRIFSRMSQTQSLPPEGA